MGKRDPVQDIPPELQDLAQRFQMFQVVHHAWAERTFGKDRYRGVIAHLRKEFETELTPALENDAPLEELRMECADVLLLLTEVASIRGFNLMEAVMEKFIINKSRRWGEKNSQGFTEHIRDGE